MRPFAETSLARQIGRWDIEVWQLGRTRVDEQARLSAVEVRVAKEAKRVTGCNPHRTDRIESPAAGKSGRFPGLGLARAEGDDAARTVARQVGRVVDFKPELC